MIFTRIIAVAAFAFHILVGCGWHQHGASFANDHGHSCVPVGHQNCCSQTESDPAQESLPSGDHGDCEVVSCVYVSVEQVEMPSQTDASIAGLIVPPQNEFEQLAWSGEALDTGELHSPHVRRHLALRHFLN